MEIYRLLNISYGSILCFRLRKSLPYGKSGLDEKKAIKKTIISNKKQQKTTKKQQKTTKKQQKNNEKTTEKQQKTNKKTTEKQQLVK